MAKYPKWCCQKCGAGIGYIGRGFMAVGLVMHDCQEPEPATKKRVGPTIDNPVVLDEETGKMRYLLSSDHTYLERATIYTKVALSAFSNMPPGIEESAVLHVLQIMEHYKRLDMRAAPRQAPPEPMDI